MSPPLRPSPGPFVEPPRSAPVWRFMAAYFARYLRRHMNALRLARWGIPGVQEHPGPIVVYANHPSWWDAAVVILLADRLFPARETFAPFDARMLEKYGIFRRLGAFPVDLDSRRGGAQFLAAARTILGKPGRVLWITAQGRFSDVRTRPLDLRPGIAHLPEIAPDALFVPLALDYAFWDQRGADAFCAFGDGIFANDLLALGRPARLVRLESALTATLDRLSADVMTRDPARFVPVIEGKRGVGGVYDLGRRLSAWARGRRFDPAHGGESVASRTDNPSQPRLHPEVRGEAEPRRSPPAGRETPGALLRGRFAVPLDEGERWTEQDRLTSRVSADGASKRAP